MNGRHAGGEVGEAGREGVRFCLLDALNTLAHCIPLEGLLLAHLVLDARDEEGDDARDAERDDGAGGLRVDVAEGVDVELACGRRTEGSELDNVAAWRRGGRVAVGSGRVAPVSQSTPSARSSGSSPLVQREAATDIQDTRARIMPPHAPAMAPFLVM